MYKKIDVSASDNIVFQLVIESPKKLQAITLQLIIGLLIKSCTVLIDHKSELEHPSGK